VQTRVPCREFEWKHTHRARDSTLLSNFQWFQLCKSRSSGDWQPTYSRIRVILQRLEATAYGTYDEYTHATELWSCWWKFECSVEVSQASTISSHLFLHPPSEIMHRDFFKARGVWNNFMKYWVAEEEETWKMGNEEPLQSYFNFTPSSSSISDWATRSVLQRIKLWNYLDSWWQYFLFREIKVLCAYCVQVYAQ